MQIIDVRRESRVKEIRVIVAILGVFFWGGSQAADTEAKSLDDSVQALKVQALELEQALSKLEEELLFPDDTRISIFLSLGTAKGFTLDAVELKLDDTIVTNYLYGARKMSALQSGGIQRLFQGNIKNGKHKFEISYIGRGTKGQRYQQTSSYIVRKKKGAKYIELSIAAPDENKEPVFSMKEWD